MKKIIISAMTKDRAIGYRGRLPWHIKEEYQHFLDCVKGNTMIMGRKSWEVFGGDVDSQVNIMLSRKEGSDETLSCASLEEAIATAEKYEGDCFIAGGAEIYKLALEKDLVDEMWLSEVDINVTGDVFFPDYDKSKWAVRQQENRGSYIFRRLIHT